MPRIAVFLLVCIGLALGPRFEVAAADEALPAPEGPAVLTVSGAIGATNRVDAAVFDMGLLKRFGGDTLVTETPWTEGQITFEGISGTALLDLVQPAGDTVRAFALNDYEVEIPVGDFRDAGLLIAYERDGSPMSVREKGPLWIVFPFSERPELNDATYQARSIWQLDRLVFE
jgi:hypothetical protein